MFKFEHAGGEWHRMGSGLCEAGREGAAIRIKPPMEGFTACPDPMRCHLPPISPK
jgi:hypothetical protein